MTNATAVIKVMARHYRSGFATQGSFTPQQLRSVASTDAGWELAVTYRYLMPVYSVRDDEVQVLAITGTCRPHSLGPQLAAEFEKGEFDKRYLRISKSGYKFTVTSLPASESSEMGEIVIMRFCKELDAGQIELERAIPVFGNLQLLDVPEIERVATAMGFLRSVYAAPTDETA